MEPTVVRIDDREFLVPHYFADGTVIPYDLRQMVIERLHSTDLSGKKAKSFVTEALASIQLNHTTLV